MPKIKYKTELQRHSNILIADDRAGLKLGKGECQLLVLVATSCILFTGLVCILEQQYPSNLFPSRHLYYDLIVYRATPSGCAAAIAAAELGASVLLLEPTLHVGGMATEGGIGLRDGFADTRVHDPRNSQIRWGVLNALHYGLSDGAVWQPDNYVGEQSFLKLLNESGVEIRLNTNFVEGSAGVVFSPLSSNIIQAFRIENSNNEELVYGKFYVDASYEGELLQAAGCSFTFGRESQATYNESSAGITNRSAGQFPVSINPFEDESDSTSSLLKYIQGRFDPRQNVGGADDNVMAFSYRVCLTMDPNNKVPLVAPKGYDPKDFELARRLVRAELSHNLTLSAPWDYLDYYGYEKIRPKQAKKYDACCGRSPFGIDNPGLSLGYANASSRAERDRIAAEHRYFVQGLMWFWQIDPVIPKATREKYADYGLCADEWVDNGHFPRQLYARETIRMVGDKVFTQNDRTPDCREDSIAVATWWFDIHNVQRAAVLNGAGTNATWTAWNEGLVTNKDATILPFDLPYWTILPKKAEVSNLAVTNCLSVSHVAFSAIREEPTLWALGNAAGAAAAIGSNEGLDSFHDVNIKTLQEALKNQGGRLHWPESGNCGAPRGKES